MRLACAGHPPPFLLRGDEPPQPIGRPGALLGAFDDADYSDDIVELEAGDVLVLYTDGVTDTRGETDRFGQERLAEALTGLCGLDAEQVADAPRRGGARVPGRPAARRRGGAGPALRRPRRRPTAPNAGTQAAVA